MELSIYSAAIRFNNVVHPVCLCWQKADSGDSGNEEPNVETDFYAKMDDGGSPHHLSLSQSQLPVSAQLHKADRLAERINNLSHPRDYRLERVPEGLIDSLPTEG